jgi:segregation and condensation protein A
LAYLVQLRQFEGPLGLLLYLIRKEEMDIFDINVVEITKQYLDYIRQMKELDLEVAGDFVAMAATLLQIKSRMLLPQYGEDGEVIENAEDPRKELVSMLLEYQRYQVVGKELYQRPLLNRDVFPRGYREDFSEDGEEGQIITEEDGLFSLIGSYRKAIKRMNRAVHQVRTKSQSISSRIMEIKDLLKVGQRVTLSGLLNPGPNYRTQLLITFLSILELGRMGFVNLFQTEIYSDIHIETMRPVERNVLERVQEFDSADAEQVAMTIMNEALDEQMASEPDDLNEELRANTSVVSTDENPLGETTEDASSIATDDEILAAEAELS